jgi:negative modulator of initiation of replication
MKKIDVDDDVYEYIVRNTRENGESASSLLRRLLGLKTTSHDSNGSQQGQMPNPPNPRPGDPDPPKVPSQLGTFLSSPDFICLRQAVDRFLALLGWLWQCDATKFEVVQEVRGRRRVYFAKSCEAILAGGRSTHPQRIPGTPWYVVTNNDTPKKQSILAQVMSRLRFCEGEIEEAVSCIEPDNAIRRKRSISDLQLQFAQYEREEQEDPGMI